MSRIITPDDDALAAAERTSTVVMVVILIGLMFLPDLFGCGGQTSARSAATSVSTDSAVAP